MRFPRCLLLPVLIFVSAFAARAEVTAEIPFRFSHQLIWIKLDVPGRHEPLNFLLDTGAGATVLNLQTARELRLGLGNSEYVQGVNGRGIAHWVNGFKATAGGMPVGDGLLAVNLEAASRACGRRIDGLLGADFLNGRVVQIDYSAAKIRLLDHAPAPERHAISLPLRRINDGFDIPVSVSGNPTEWVRLDTGCDEALHWVIGKHDKLQYSRTVSVGLSQGSRHSATVDIRLGADSIRNVTIGFQKNQIFPGESGLMGNPLLAGYTVIIDTRSNRLLLEKTAAEK